ncbi:MAG: hypothetical protein HY673_09385 [Chloroflexi bacterium]|nr:hypothetical protein [Chloroflexota bacterium]
MFGLAVAITISKIVGFILAQSLPLFYPNIALEVLSVREPEGRESSLRRFAVIAFVTQCPPSCPEEHVGGGQFEKEERVDQSTIPA